jgi:hypothetical protein
MPARSPLPFVPPEELLEVRAEQNTPALFACVFLFYIVKIKYREDIPAKLG